MKFNIVVAIDSMCGIGDGCSMLWYLKGDMRWFNFVTTFSNSNAVIMGRKTWNSLPTKCKPLPNRTNIVLSNSGINYGDITFNKIDKVLDYCYNKFDNICVIGGRGIYDIFLNDKYINYVKYLYITHINKNFNCSVKFPGYSNLIFKEKTGLFKMRENGVSYEIVRYKL